VLSVAIGVKLLCLCGCAGLLVSENNLPCSLIFTSSNGFGPLLFLLRRLLANFSRDGKIDDLVEVHRFAFEPAAEKRVVESFLRGGAVCCRMLDEQIINIIHGAVLKSKFPFQTHREFGSIAKLNAEGTGQFLGHGYFDCNISL
jgi:hypothetical protein